MIFKNPKHNTQCPNRNVMSVQSLWNPTRGVRPWQLRHQHTELRAEGLILFIPDSFLVGAPYLHFTVWGEQLLIPAPHFLVILCPSAPTHPPHVLRDLQEISDCSSWVSAHSKVNFRKKKNQDMKHFLQTEMTPLEVIFYTGSSASHKLDTITGPVSSSKQAVYFYCTHICK